jgi:hypothetical protein
VQHPLVVTLDAARLTSEAARCLYRWRLAPQKFGLASTTRYRHSPEASNVVSSCLRQLRPPSFGSK